MDFGRTFSADCRYGWCPARFGSLVIGAILLMAGAAPLHASLVVPELPAFKLKAEAVGGGSRSNENARDDDSDDTPDRQVIESQILLVGSTYGRISTSSPTAGGLGLSLVADSQCSDENLHNLQVVGRITGKRRPTLPIPPPSKLLRPPQST